MSIDINSQNTPEAFKPQSTDLLSANKFFVVINRFPKINFYTQRIPIPNVTLGSSIYYTNQDVDIKVPGDKIEYDDLILSLLMDENLSGYIEIYDWLRACANSELEEKDDLYSTLSIIFLTNNSQKNITFKFHNCFPYAIGGSGIDVSESEDQPLTMDVIFKYSHFTIEK